MKRSYHNRIVLANYLRLSKILKEMILNPKLLNSLEYTNKLRRANKKLNKSIKIFLGDNDNAI